MFNKHQNSHQKEIRYKWDQDTGSGYRLRFDSSEHRFQVQDWHNHVVVDAVGCDDLDEALDVLNRFFTIDVAQERSRIAGWLPQPAM